jgi:hypothetical protein
LVLNPPSVRRNFQPIKKLALFLLLVFPLTQTALRGQKAAQDPGDYPVIVHVAFSRTVSVQSYPEQQLQVVIDGQQVELSSYAIPGILAPGDYRGRLVVNLHGPKNPTAYDLFEEYLLLLPDGKTRKFQVTGLGPKGN